MIHSIRFKLFAVICGLILLFVALSWLLNNFFLENYYLHNKKLALMESYHRIDEVYKGDPEAISLELEMVENTRGTRIVILDEYFRIKYLYNQRNPEGNQEGNPDGFPRRQGRGRAFEFARQQEEMARSRSQMLDEQGTWLETGRDPGLNINFIRLFVRLNNGDHMVLSTSVAAIEENVEIANQFFLFTGLVTLLVGSVLVLLATGRFTRPVLELNRITRSMATLDFSRRYSGKTRDEIGQLGGSINSLAEQLQQSISELTEANQKLRRDIEKERRIDEMRKEFISNVSHELKTPIALIQGYAEGLKVNVNKDEENKNYYCDTIVDEAAKMNKLVKQLLELSQIESGVVFMEKSRFDAVGLVREVLRKSRLLFPEGDAEVAIDGEERLFVHADYDMMEQVLTNYLNNAFHHLDERGGLRIHIERNGTKARITVFNSGAPIPPESLDKIWISFYKVDKARTRAYGGSGLGLSIVRAIQDAHGNGYGVRNVEGGVEFWFEMDTE